MWSAHLGNAGVHPDMIWSTPPGNAGVQPDFESIFIETARGRFSFFPGGCKRKFFGQQQLLIIVLLHCLHVQFISVGRPAACGANVYAVLTARADELQGFWSQPGVLETLLRNRLCILFVSGGRPKAHDANANACRRALANELQGFSDD